MGYVPPPPWPDWKAFEKWLEERRRFRRYCAVMLGFAALLIGAMLIMIGLSRI